MMSAVKLFILLFIVCTGFAALGGHLNVPNSHNFDLSTSFQGTSKNGYNIGTALLDAIFSFQGYDNMNMASTLALQGRSGFADQG
jgi:amino acid permease